MQSGHRRRSYSGYRHVLAFLAAGLIVTGARLWLAWLYATSLPINDQWGSEGYYLLKPWLEGRLTFADLFSPHNEHRIFFSRLLTLALTYCNGQWDSLVTIVFNAVFAGIIAVLVLKVLFFFFEDRFHAVILLTVTLWLGLPYSYENTLWAFQSSFYFLLFFSLVGLWGLTLHSAFSLRWFVGAVGAVCACLSMGSGVLAGLAVGIVLLLQVIFKQCSVRDVGPTALLVAVIMAVSWYFQVTVPQHAIFKAQSFMAGLCFFGRCLAWPWPDYPLMAIVAYAPFCVVVAREISARRAGETRSARLVWLLFGVGLWVILQAAAVAYSRGGTGHSPIASRYLDIVGLGVVINALCLCLGLTWPRKERSRRLIAWVGRVWLVLALILGVLASNHEIRQQAGRQKYLHTAEKTVRAYLVTKDRRYLEGEPHPVPYPDIAAVAVFLDDRTIQGLLPAPARLPLQVEKRASADGNFAQPGCPPTIATSVFEKSWGSYAAQGATGRGSMESELIRPRLPYLEFEIAGGLGPEMCLSVENGDHKNRVRWLQRYSQDPNRPQWRLAYSALPGAAVDIVARDNSTEEWFAFREPSEMGRFSYYSFRLTQAGKAICLWGTGLCLLLLLRSLFPLSMWSRNKIAPQPGS